MAITLGSLGLRDREFEKFQSLDIAGTGSLAISVALYASSGTEWFPVLCNANGAIVTGSLA